MSQLSEATATVVACSSLVSDDVSVGTLTYTDFNMSNLATEQLYVTNLTVNNEMKFGDNNVNITAQSSPGNIQFGVDLGTPTTGENNLKFGLQAGNGITTGTGNILLQEGAGASLTDQNNNVAVGLNACVSGIAGTAQSSNVCIGSQAGSGALGTVAGGCVAIGQEALSTESGDLNVAIGLAAASTITVNGSDNIIIGNNTLSVNQILEKNTVVGTNANLDGNYSNTVVLGAYGLGSVSQSINIGRQQAMPPFSYKNLVLGNAPGGGVSSSLIPGPFASDAAAHNDMTHPVPLGGLYYYTYLPPLPAPQVPKTVLCICLRTV